MSDYSNPQHWQRHWHIHRQVARLSSDCLGFENCNMDTSRRMNIYADLRPLLNGGSLEKWILLSLKNMNLLIFFKTFEGNTPLLQARWRPEGAAEGCARDVVWICLASSCKTWKPQGTPKGHQKKKEIQARNATRNLESSLNPYTTFPGSMR